MKKRYKTAIISELMHAERLTLSQLEKAIIKGAGKKQSKEIAQLKNALKELTKAQIVLLKKGSYQLSGRGAFFEGEIVRVFRAHGFVVDRSTGEEFFVRGRDLLGCVPGDTVLARVERDDRGGQSRLAKVLALLEPTGGVLTGIIVAEDKTLYLLPDSFVSEPLPIVSWNSNQLRVGDKVKFTLRKRGARHSDHVVDIDYIYGKADNARVSVMAYFDEKNIPTEFPLEVIDSARRIENKGIAEQEKKGRLDLRDTVIFTIDGADTKDIDDAISIEKTQNGYKLGVHIADVSHYVKLGGEIDKEAFQRGTSVYVADLVIPMLPKELSNGICSLNPNEERLAFSCLMDITEDGKLNDFAFKKTVIKSRVQGVYSEINSIIEGNADEKVKEKYSEIADRIPLMVSLAQVLRQNRANRGAPPIITDESKIICDKKGKCIDIKNRTSGISENIIEEFMLMANNAAARLAMSENIPFVYRVHEAPSGEKLTTLAEALVFLGIDNLGINENSKASDLARVLKAVEGSERAEVINVLVLRTMMKARYSEEPIGHFGLVMDEYAHFTSPIRRYPDLTIHRILSDYIKKGDKTKFFKKYEKFVVSAAAKSSSTELAAVGAERDCDKFYMAEYMNEHIGEEYDGIISGVTGNGVFIKLPNTVEGRVDLITMPPGEYDVVHNIALVEQLTLSRYMLGDKVRVKCEKVSIAAGMVDFVFV